MRYFNTPGLILKKQPSGENDWYLHIFSPHYGKIQALSRSSRKISSQKGGHLDPLNLCHFQLYKNGNRYLVTECKVENAFMSIKSSLPHSLAAFSIMELLLRSLQEDAENPYLFQLTLDTLDKVSISQNLLYLEEFKIKLLKDAGSWPDVAYCFYCQNRWTPEDQIACDQQGHLTCSTCLTLPTTLLESVNFSIIKLAKHLSQHHSTQIKLRLSAEELFQLKKLTGIFVQNYLQQGLKSEKIFI